jgi:hypothetical protein
MVWKAPLERPEVQASGKTVVKKADCLQREYLSHRDPQDHTLRAYVHQLNIKGTQTLGCFNYTRLGPVGPPDT